MERFKAIAGYLAEKLCSDKKESVQDIEYREGDFHFHHQLFSNHLVERNQQNCLQVNLLESEYCQSQPNQKDKIQVEDCCDEDEKKQNKSFLKE